MFLGIHDLYGEAGERSSATDNLSSRADFRNLLGHAGLAQCNRILVDGNDIAAAERNRQSVFCQPVCDKEAFRLKSMRLKCLQKPRVCIRFDGFGGNEQLSQRTEIAVLQTLLRNPPSAQAI